MPECLTDQSTGMWCAVLWCGANRPPQYFSSIDSLAGDGGRYSQPGSTASSPARGQATDPAATPSAFLGDGSVGGGLQVRASKASRSNLDIYI